jgi:hypothetical protein
VAGHEPRLVRAAVAVHDLGPHARGAPADAHAQAADRVLGHRRRDVRRLPRPGLADRDFTAKEAEYRLLCAEFRISCTEDLRAGQRESGYADHRAALDELIAGAARLVAPALII